LPPPGLRRPLPHWSRGAIRSVAFSPDGRQLIAVLLHGDIRVYEMEPILARLNLSAPDFLAETERWTGLHLQEDSPLPVQRDAGPRGDAEGSRRLPTYRPVIVPRLHLVREGEPLRKTYQQDPVEFFRRYSGIDMRHHKEAKKELLRLLQEPGVPESHEGPVRTALASAHMALGEFEQAKAQVRKVLEKAPDDALAQQTLVQIQLQEKRHGEARDLLLQALEMPGLLPEAKLTTHWHLAGVYARMGDLSRAEAEAEKAAAVKEADLHPVVRRNLHASALLSLGRVYVQQRRFPGAMAQVDQVLQMDLTGPVVQAARLLRAEIQMEMGELDKANAEISGVLTADKDNPAALAARASLAALRAKDLEQAEAVLRTLVEDEPTNPWYQVTLAQVQARRGQAGQALPILEKLSRDEQVGRSPVFFDILGDVYALARRPDKARQAWQKALGLFPKTTDPADHRRQAIRDKIDKSPLAPGAGFPRPAGGNNVVHSIQRRFRLWEECDTELCWPASALVP
jgi:tetratricopeptide (TPR) repeat protein